MKPNLTDAAPRAALAERLPSRQPREAAGFWADFRVRAEDLPRHAARPSPRLLVPLAAAAAVALAAGTFFAVRNLLPPPAAAVAGGTFRDYEVVVPHQAVMIFEDPSGAGAILWVVVASENGDPQGGAGT